ncbi:MAG: DUF29 domain-containing protein [Cyanobacteria bacterium]|nr:DUF29 domain-containing protein [Cyanobacteriota bacterium]
MDVTYEADYYGWLQQQIALIKGGRLSELDAGNLLEELESLGRSERRALASQIARLYLHLLKWLYQPEKRSRSWLISIGEAQDEIEQLLEDNPSFRRSLEDEIAKGYALGRRKAARETGLAIAEFPDQPPLSFEEAMAFEGKLDPP